MGFFDGLADAHMSAMSFSDAELTQLITYHYINQTNLFDCEPEELPARIAKLKKAIKIIVSEVDSTACSL